MGEARLRLPDSAHFSEQGRRLLIELGAIEPDPLRVEAERWLLGARRDTFVTRRVRAELASPYSARHFAEARAMRAVH